MVYRNFIRPILFLADPETVHYLVVLMLKCFFCIPGSKKLFKLFFSFRDSSLERTVFGIRFENPVGLAAGFDKNCEIYNELSVFGFSFIEIGTVTPKEQPGNIPPRSFRLPADKALINRMGINNQGVLKIAAKLRKEKPNIILGGNIGKNTLTPNHKAIDDYIFCFEALHELVDYFVINVSCPNIGDIEKLQDADTLIEILGQLKKLSRKKPFPKPLLLKISPDLSFEQLDEIINIVLKTGTDGIVATNTTISRENLITPIKKVASVGEGGLSGLPLRDRSTEVIRYLVKKSDGKIPVIATGGVMSPRDAIDKLDAGASLVQLYTGFIYEGPSIVKRLNRAILHQIQEQKY